MAKTMQDAKDRLTAAITGLAGITEAEVRTLAWLARWDIETVDNIASVIEKARRS